ncbi:MAG: dTDP-glucose 4,6-dehydratase [Sphingomonadales bacterium]|nr:MAG: dTDP-glucose 4,6-dehydratase [Sphingomonadales bacterium]
MRLAVTGGAGFIGSAVVRLAIARGHEVLNIDALTYAGCLANLETAQESERYRFARIDIRARDALARTIAEFAPHAIMHLAAESHVDRSIAGPSDFIETNVLGTFNVLEAAREYWVQAKQPDSFRLLHVSTDEVFGSLGSTGTFTEDSPHDPSSPYSASKAASDHLSSAWHKTYGLPVALTRCSNNYGPYQFPEKLIPRIIMNAVSGQKLPVYGTGSNIRDWLHVSDHAEALMLVLECGEVGQSYNIGAGNECSNLELVERICVILDRLKPKQGGQYSDLINFVDDRPGHDWRYAINASKIREELGWRPAIPFDAGLESTISWYLDNLGKWPPLIERCGVAAAKIDAGAM